MIALAGVDEWGLRRAAATLAGRAHHIELSAKRRSPLVVEHGKPGVDRWRFTVTPESQRIELD